MALATLTGVAVLVPGGGAALAAGPGKGATVVERVDRSPIGNMLASATGASLYIHPNGPCTGTCLQVWPRLLMPTGKTKPKGAQCLSTKATKAGLQVEYHGQLLYTFVDDTGTSETGNGVGGFLAAKITKNCP